MPALVIAWSALEAHRLGEVAFLDPPGPWVLGRGSEEEQGRERLRFGEQRPGGFTPTGGLRGDSLSRRQLLFMHGASGIEVQNVGRAKLVVDDRETERGLLQPGCTLTITRQMVLLFTLRPRVLPETRYPTHTPFGEPDAFGILGESPAAWALRDRVAFAAASPLHVLVRGPSGTGKELVAAAIHALSRRARGPFLAKNAATIPSTLIDAELFGNAKNYPNPGMSERAGLVGDADGGTLFLDEIAELPHELQARFLRVLDRAGEYQRLGESAVRRADLRVIGATNRDPDALKHDIRARLTLRVEVPSLNERREDIPLLVRHLVLRAAEYSPEIAARFVRRASDGGEDVLVGASLISTLLGHTYSTNVRELETILWKAMEAAPAADAMPLRAPRIFRATASTPTGTPPPDHGSEADELLGGLGAPAAQVRAVLVSNEWQIERTAKELGMSRHQLKRLMKKYGIKPR